jgi:hypothetical protein
MKRESEGAHLLKALIITGVVLAVTLLGGRWLAAQDQASWQDLARNVDLCKIVVTADQHVHVLWTAYDFESDQRLLYHKEWDGSTWREMLPWGDIGHLESVVADQKGNLHILWTPQETTEDPSDTCFDRYLYHASWNGERWSPETLVAHSCDPVPAVIVAGTGQTLHILWGAAERTLAGEAPPSEQSWLLHFISDDGGTTWHEPERITTYSPDDQMQYFGFLSATSDATGRVYLVWTYGLKSYYSFWEMGSGWSAPIDLTDYVGGTWPSIAVGPQDKVHVAGVAYGQVRYLVSEGHTLDSMPISLTGLWQTAGRLKIVVDGTSRVHVLWDAATLPSYPTGGFHDHLFYSWMDRDGYWTQPVDLSAPLTGLYTLDAAVDDQGILHIAWISEDDKILEGRGTHLLYRAILPEAPSTAQPLDTPAIASQTPSVPTRPTPWVTVSLVTACCAGWLLVCVTSVIAFIAWRQKKSTD